MIYLTLTRYSYALQSAEVLLNHPESVEMDGNMLCYHCADPMARSGDGHDAWMVAMDERYERCIVMPGTPGKCVRCIWRNGKQCEYAKTPYVIPVAREPKPTASQLAAAMAPPAPMSLAERLARANISSPRR